MYRHRPYRNTAGLIYFATRRRVFFCTSRAKMTSFEAICKGAAWLVTISMAISYGKQTKKSTTKSFNTAEK